MTNIHRSVAHGETTGKTSTRYSFTQMTSEKSSTPLTRLLTPSLEECLAKYAKDYAFPLFLAGPEQLPDTKGDIPSNIIKHLSLQTGRTFDVANSRILLTGRAGGLQAIEVAFRYLEASGEEFSLVGGVQAWKYALHTRYPCAG